MKVLITAGPRAGSTGDAVYRFWYRRSDDTYGHALFKGA